ncbi:MAG: glycosyltransferase family 2 protein [Myxococcales bacterium]|nr:glycosyltransferase family 2 protein [Myxococcales bacterium]MCB9579928.1 glycosyltransferase family 2 protein [Polyangiaceae bacterium]
MRPKLSFVIPFLDEEQTLAELFDRIAKAVAPLLAEGETWELVFVDDGSRDESVAVVEELVEKHPEVRLVELQGNFGKSAALSAGFSRAQGRVVFTLDADLQDDPKEIPRFLEKLDEGYDLVSGYKQQRNDPITKVFPSRVFNWMVRRATGITLHDVNCGFKAYRDVVLKNVRLYGELHRFVPVLAHWKRFRVGELVVEHHARKFGHSKFGGGRFFRGLMDLLTVVFLMKYERRPAHFFGGIGGATLLLGVVICGYLAVIWFGGQSIGHRPLLSLGVLLIVVGVQILATGMIAELMVHSRADVPYVVRREIGQQDVGPARATAEPSKQGVSAASQQT